MSGRGLEAQPHAPDAPVSRDAILDQLNRILTSTLFKHSKRCGPLLKYIVTEAIEGRAEHLKERAVGMAVFGRTPTYNTSDDPIVRTSAVEVRKRIAQYYHEEGHEAETRIDLPSGSYIPKFQLPPSDLAAPLKLAVAEPTPSDLATVPVLTATVVPPPVRKTVLFYLAVVGAIIAVVSAGLVVFSIRSREPVRAFWNPLFTSDSIILVMGNVAEFGAPASGQGTPEEPTFYDTIQADRVGFADGLTIARVAALAKSNGKEFEVRRGGSLTLLDLRKAPAVVVGALNNPWMSRLQDHLRYRIVYDDSTATSFLIDQQNPGKPLWTIKRDTPYLQTKEDRAVVSRFVDPRTEQTVLLLSGFGRDGTAAAGEFVTEAKYLQALAANAPSGWRKKNLQAVIATELINGHSGPPRIVATWFW
jgi:hypothetical protein